MSAMRVLLFAGLAETVGESSVHLEEPLPSTVGELLSQLEDRFPQTAWQGVRIAVDQCYVALDHPLHATQEIAAIPPVSGG